MKLLLFFILLNGALACSSGAIDSEGNPLGDTAEEEQQTGEKGDDTLGSGPDDEQDKDKDKEKKDQSKPSQQVFRQGACANYPLSCGADPVLCGNKYQHCLAPNAGEPSATHSVVCSKEGEQTLTLLVNTWNRPAGQNKLLCDFWENTSEEEVLYFFATNQKKACQVELSRRKASLVRSAYKCE